MDATTWNERYAAAEPVWSLGPNVFVACELADIAPGTALDLAAGEGRNALWLARRGWRVTAVDFAEAGLARGRGLDDTGRVTWVVADVTTWTAPVPVDLVVVAYLQLPASERRSAVSRAWASLADGGTLLWVAHDSTNLTEGYGGPQDPTVLMTAEDVLADLDAAGASYDVVRAGREERRTQSGSVALDCLVRVTRSASSASRASRSLRDSS